MLLKPQLSVNLLPIKWSSMWNPLMLEMTKIFLHLVENNGVLLFRRGQKYIEER